MRKAESNGYCNKCTQLNAKSCLYCSNINKTIKKENIKEFNESFKQKSRHNPWIDGLEKGMNFFHYTYKLGAGIFYVLVFITCLWFWATYALGFPDETRNFLGVAALMIFLFRLIMFFVAGGLIFKFFCYYLSVFLSNKEERELLKEGREKYVNNK